MSKKKNRNKENETPQVTETVEESVGSETVVQPEDDNSSLQDNAEAATETTETATEDAETDAESAENAETAADNTEVTEEISENDSEEETGDTTDAKTEPHEENTESGAASIKGKRKILLAVIGGILLVTAVVVYMVYGKSIRYAINNPYNKDYVDVRGETVGEYAKLVGKDYSEFLREYALPEDMPKSTNMTAASYAIPAWKYAELSYMTFEEFKNAVGLGDDVTGDTPIGEVFDSMTVAQRVGADKVEQFKQEFELDDSVTASTKWVKVRNIVDTEMKKRYGENKNGGVNKLPPAETEDPAQYALNNPYDKDYVDVRNETVGEYAKFVGKDYSEFLREYALPEDMPKSTHMTAASYAIPAWKYAELSNMTFEELKNTAGLSDDITGDMPIGEVFDSMTVAQRVGADKVEQFKQEFELDDSVTASTKWVKVRNIVDTEMKKRYGENKNGGVNKLPLMKTGTPAN